MRRYKQAISPESPAQLASTLREGLLSSCSWLPPWFPGVRTLGLVLPTFFAKLPGSSDPVRTNHSSLNLPPLCLRSLSSVLTLYGSVISHLNAFRKRLGDIQQMNLKGLSEVHWLLTFRAGPQSQAVRSQVSHDVPCSDCGALTAPGCVSRGWRSGLPSQMMLVILPPCIWEPAG